MFKLNIIEIFKCCIILKSHAMIFYFYFYIYPYLSYCIFIQISIHYPPLKQSKQIMHFQAHKYLDGKLVNK